MKSLLFVSLLLVATLAIPVAKAQLGLVGGLLGLIIIQGTLFCTSNGNMDVSAPQPQYFLRGAGKVVSSATSNGSGIFSIVLDPIQYAVSSLLTDCGLVVKTPLSTCNAGVPSSGGLLSLLQSTGNVLLGLLKVDTIEPAGFQFLPQLMT